MIYKKLFLILGILLLCSVVVTLITITFLSKMKPLPVKKCIPICNDKTKCNYDDGCNGKCKCTLGSYCDNQSCKHLSYKFKPIIYFNSAEKFFPTSIENMLSVSSLTLGDDKNILVKPGDITTNNIGTFNSKYDPSSTPQGYNLRINVSEKSHEGDPSFKESVNNKQMKITNNVPIYVHYYDLDKSTMVIQYMFLYNYNGSHKFPILGDLGQHPGDLEHISVYVDKNTEKITKIYFAAHSTETGMFINASNIQFEEDRPIIYAARSSHASYPSKGHFSVNAAYGLYDDVTDDTGLHWYTENIVFIDENTPWNQFKGNLGGKGGPRTPMSQGWWNKGI